MERGLNIFDYFEGVRPWGQLVRFVNHLPGYSATGRAMADDDELAAWREQQMTPAQRARGPRPPKVTEWTFGDELLTTMVDMATAIRTTLVALQTPKGRQAPKFKPARRPITAAQRIERRKEQQTVADIVAIARPRAALPPVSTPRDE
jgi:hypothetical protein